MFSSYLFGDRQGRTIGFELNSVDPFESPRSSRTARRAKKKCAFTFQVADISFLSRCDLIYVVYLQIRYGEIRTWA